MCRRLEYVEKKLAFLEGKESQEGIIGTLSSRINMLEDELILQKSERYTDNKTCRKVEGEVLLKPSHLANTFINSDRVIGSHPPVIIEKHRDRDCGDRDRD
jgi:hypothetical protein